MTPLIKALCRFITKNNAVLKDNATIKSPPKIDRKGKKYSAKYDIAKSWQRPSNNWYHKLNAILRYNKGDFFIESTGINEWKSAVVDGDITDNLHKDYLLSIRYDYIYIRCNLVKLFVR